MIADKMENIGKYASLLPHAKIILDYLSKTNLLDLVPDKYSVSDSSVYCLIQEYMTKPESEKKWESHKKYIDIQIVLSGSEYMGYFPISDLVIEEPYNSDKDIIFYKQINRDFCSLYIPQDSFCIFFPEDAHKPGYHRSNEFPVKKAVIKVLCT